MWIWWRDPELRKAWRNDFRRDTIKNAWFLSAAVVFFVGAFFFSATFQDSTSEFFARYSIPRYAAIAIWLGAVGGLGYGWHKAVGTYIDAAGSFRAQLVQKYEAKQAKDNPTPSVD